MKIILLMANILIWSILVQYFLPWWTIGIISFVVAYLIHLNKFISFTASLLAIFVLWSLKAWYSDAHFDEPMSTLLGSLLGNISGSAVFFLTGLIGGLCAGLCGLLGSWTRTLSNTSIPHKG